MKAYGMWGMVRKRMAETVLTLQGCVTRNWKPCGNKLIILHVVNETNLPFPHSFIYDSELSFTVCFSVCVCVFFLALWKWKWMHWHVFEISIWKKKYEFFFPSSSLSLFLLLLFHCMMELVSWIFEMLKCEVAKVIHNFNMLINFIWFVYGFWICSVAGDFVDWSMDKNSQMWKSAINICGKYIRPSCV